MFLVPTQGRDEIVSLHDRLYAGPLAPDLRRDIAFVPHITVARAPSLEHAKELASTLGPFDVRAPIDELTVVTLSSGAIVRSRSVPLLERASAF